MPESIIHIVKIGGNIIDDETLLQVFLKNLASFKDLVLLVHGGGKIATQLSETLGIKPQMVDGRRITDAHTLDVVTMVYAGLINKKIVALLQSHGRNAIGLSGVDANIIPATKRKKEPRDFGFVGEVKPEMISVKTLDLLLQNQMLPVIASIAHDGQGQLLNTNADTIASGIAIALSNSYKTKLYYCFEKNGVLENGADQQSVIPELSEQRYTKLKQSGVIHSGMIPKLDNAFTALHKGVREVFILNALVLSPLTTNNHGTKLVK
jgi:acetylglutamate kinase